MIIKDNVITNQALLKSIQNDEHNIFIKDGCYSLWYPGEGVQNTTELLIEHLIKLLELDISKCVSIEHWTFPSTKLTASNRWHRNTNVNNEGHVLRQITPIYSLVYFPIPIDIEGGYLEISSKRGDITPYDKEGKRNKEGLLIDLLPNHKEILGELQRIKPVYNRAIVFDGDLWHRVSPHIGDRWSLSVDFWGEDILDDFHCRDLIYGESNEWYN